MTESPRPADTAGSPYKWAFAESFLAEFAALRSTDQFASAAIFAVMKIAEQGGCDDVNCEFPMSVSHGLIGELRIDVGATKYRLYFAQPATDFTVLVALKLGSKTHDEDGRWREQQNLDIREAVSRYYKEYLRM